MKKNLGPHKKYVLVRIVNPGQSGYFCHVGITGKMMTIVMAMKRGTRKRIYCYGKRSQIRPMLEPVLGSDNILLSFHSSHKDCLEKLEAKPCDILIVDLEDGDAEGLELLVQARRMAPWISTMAVVEHSAVPMAVRVIKAGACECLEKPLQPDRLCEAVDAMLLRMESLPRSHRALTQMEVQIIQLILAGETSQDIAARLHRSKRTIDVHRKNIMRKLQAGSLVDLIRRVLAMGLGEEPLSDGAPEADGWEG